MFFLPSTSWKVQETPTKGKGVFASKNLAPGTIIGDYLGIVIHPKDSPTHDKHFYLMYYHDTASIVPNIEKPGIHLINHSCAPNCWVYTYKGHTLFFSLRKIFKGEELTISYLLGPKQPYCKQCTHICVCGSIYCTKSMHLTEKRYQSWSAFHERQSKQTKRARIQYGKQLSPLDSYPKDIPDNHIYTLFGSESMPSLRLNHTVMPGIKHLRKRIRETGQTIVMPHLHKKIYGISENTIIYSNSLPV